MQQTPPGPVLTPFASPIPSEGTNQNGTTCPVHLGNLGRGSRGSAPLAGLRLASLGMEGVTRLCGGNHGFSPLPSSFHPTI